jgi:hypothetical protein
MAFGPLQTDVTEDFSVIRDAAKGEDFQELKSMVKGVNKGNGSRMAVTTAIDRAAGKVEAQDEEYGAEAGAAGTQDTKFDVNGVSAVSDI